MRGVDPNLHPFYLQIRFRVLSIKYPPIPNEPKKDAEPFSPMEITVSFAILRHL